MHEQIERTDMILLLAKMAQELGWKVKVRIDLEKMYSLISIESGVLNSRLDNVVFSLPTNFLICRGFEACDTLEIQSGSDRLVNLSVLLSYFDKIMKQIWVLENDE